MTDPVADKIIARAREWIGTPYKHQRHEKGQFCDCIGLICGVVNEVPELERAPYYGDYGKMPIPAVMLGRLRAHADEIAIARIQPGDIVAMGWHGTGAHHVAWYCGGDPLTIIHAHESIGSVREQRFYKRDRRLRTAFRPRRK